MSKQSKHSPNTHTHTHTHTHTSHLSVRMATKRSSITQKFNLGSAIKVREHVDMMCFFCVVMLVLVLDMQMVFVLRLLR
jgi:hypothetical protein